MKDHHKLSHNDSKHGLLCESESERDQYGKSHKNSNLPLVTLEVRQQSQHEMEMSFIESDYIEGSNRD